MYYTRVKTINFTYYLFQMSDIVFCNLLLNSDIFHFFCLLFIISVIAYRIKQKLIQLQRLTEKAPNIHPYI